MQTIDPRSMRGLSDKSRRVRMAQARAKRYLAQAATTEESRERAAEMLMDSTPDVERMLVRELLGACRWTGPERARQMLRRNRIDPSTTVDRLDLGERLRLVQELRGVDEQLELVS